MFGIIGAVLIGLGIAIAHGWAAWIMAGAWLVLLWKEECDEARRMDAQTRAEVAAADAWAEKNPSVY